MKVRAQREVWKDNLLSRRRQVSTAAMRHFGSHANRFPERGVRMNRLADIDRVGAHLDRQRHLADHVASVRADHAATQDLPVAMGLR